MFLLAWLMLVDELYLGNQEPVTMESGGSELWKTSQTGIQLQLLALHGK